MKETNYITKYTPNNGVLFFVSSSTYLFFYSEQITNFQATKAAKNKISLITQRGMSNFKEIYIILLHAQFCFVFKVCLQS